MSGSLTKTQPTTTVPERGLTATGTVCQVLHSLNVGGAEVLSARLGRKLQDRFRFVFACLDDLGPLHRQLEAEGFAVEMLRRRPGLDLRCIRRLARFIRRERVSIIHAHQYTPFFYALSARMFGPRVPVVFTEHGRWFPDCPRRRRIWFNRLLLRSRDRVVGVGESVRQALIDNEGIPAPRVEVIYNGVDLAAYDAAPLDRLQTRAELGVAEEEPLILQVARLDGLKDHRTAIRAFARVVAEQPAAKLMLVGDGPEQRAIEEEIAERSIADRVQQLGLRDDVPRLLRAADLFLLTSISEGIPLTVIEAMGAGLPVVATRVGGVPEVVEHGETGLLAPSGDDSALAAAMLELLRDPARREQFGAAGKAKAQATFSEAENHRAYARLYEDLLDA